MSLLLALLLAAAQPAAAPAQPAPDAGVSSPAVRPDSMALTRLVNPEELTIKMLVRSFEDSLRTMVGSNEDYLALEKEYPGVSEAVVAAMLDVMRADAIAELPKMRERYARFYAEHFSPAETAELIRFYSSKTGQRLVAAKLTKLDAKPLTGELLKSPDGQVSKDHIQAMNRAASGSIAEEITPEDLAALKEFSQTPVFRKLTSARGAMEQLEADIANEPDPELDKALEAATERAIAKFMGADPSE